MPDSPREEPELQQIRMKNCKNIGDPQPVKKHVNADGLVVEEKINPMPCHKKMIDPNGHVSQVSLASGYTIRGLGTHNPYGVQALAEKLKGGWLPYDQCPVKEGYMKAGKGEKALKPCEGKFSRDECCPHIEQAIKARRAAYNKKQQAFKRQMQTNPDRMLELLEKQTEALAKAEQNSDPGKNLR
jgi:hypothetical protein